MTATLNQKRGGGKTMRESDYHVCNTGIEFFSFLGFFSVSSSSVSFAFLYGLYEGFLDSILIQCIECIALYSFTVSSVAQSCLTLCNPMDCSTSGFSVHHQIPELAQIHVHRVSDGIQPSHPLVIPFSYLQSFPASGSFPMSQFFASDGQNIGVSASV